jgi:hypothetical protein
VTVEGDLVANGLDVDEAPQLAFDVHGGSSLRSAGRPPITINARIPLDAAQKRRRFKTSG